MRTLNLGILAHVDAGKTSLTERLLFDVGVIDKLGSVDTGNTQTDSLELERQRGITIRAAVVSFTIGDTVVNLIDTPGHPDFIAEVERVLGLLDAAVVVVSAVEGVQAQTRVLVRALQRLAVPFLFFINKVDRVGARYDEVVRDLADQLRVRPVVMSKITGAGSKHVQVAATDTECEPLFTILCETLAENDDELLRDYLLTPDRVDAGRLSLLLGQQTACGVVHPAFAGVAMTGAGLPALIAAITEMLPARDPDPEGEISGKIFKIERGWGGEKLSYLHLASGTVRLRHILPLPQGPARLTGIQLFKDGRVQNANSLGAGQIARVTGLAGARVGDSVGVDAVADGAFHFAPPTLETRVVSRRPSEHAALWLALNQMVEQDPLIGLRRNDETNEVFVSLYGEVQKQIIQSELSTGFGIEAEFEDSTVICVERLSGSGQGLQTIFREPNPFFATIGLRVEPRPDGAGNSFALEVEFGQMPASFYRAVEETVFDTLKQGVFGWQVQDCHVAMTAARHTSPSSTAADFRKLTPWVLGTALKQAQPFVCEPFDHFHIEAPAAAITRLISLLAKAGAATKNSVISGGVATLEGTIASAAVQGVQQQVPGLTSGLGGMETSFSHYAQAESPPSPRRRSGPDPFNECDYLLRMRRNAE
ncbi:GTP-binding protein [Agrobacterium tumefaciens]|uniref:Tetracycline resistance protein, tetM/tetO subfamily n=1 Tax=Agrobacterium fabrum (strain C58 / ATCC 33970) TaxID=176299 RepID=A9CJ73_AGRFC|nr:TetM/TetW/TetO/TetS family tetracycline resistance ribosomal protection protein [Agrobacterium fabrum]KEY55732.1 GTP-binding protein [Agrobacterium tumefaciens]AAK87139.1 Tetracycline resistance protein, tetM/tetO subfamily [Agrobacterium fabrum str. C58]KJX88542.1 Elongation factor G EF-G [Agrobacterium tumefaciens]MCX2873827.1 TetM/TetW/TetO/TetS family tetracycline resistance ribosomal protection protein [Agrobacterium fabrum]NMV67987.1 TetM/TetW/TetO/TetS family tetracycline resistance 